MTILIISDLETTGGAAIACQRLALGLSRLGVHCVRAVGKRDGGDVTQEVLLLSPGKRLDGIVAFVESLGQPKLADKIMRFGVKRQLPLLIERLKPDCVNIHNLHKANWDIELVEECARRVPVVWTLHDMWSMTGRCPYNQGCEKFMSGCDASCPTPQEYPSLEPERIAGAWSAKKAVLERHSNIAAVCPSAWMASQARQGIWKNNRIEVVHNGLDLTVYKPRDLTACRQALGLEPNLPTILVVAEYLKERRKGGGMLAEVLAAAKSRPLQILTLGHNPPQISMVGIRHTHLGYITSDLMKSLVYSSADVLLHMAPVDNLPNTVAESIACGTPVVAYATGGVPEMVKADQTGWMSNEFDPQSFAATLDEALDTLKSGFTLRQSCREFAEVHFDLERQASHYMDLFQALRTQTQ